MSLVVKEQVEVYVYLHWKLKKGQGFLLAPGTAGELSPGCLIGLCDTLNRIDHVFDDVHLRSGVNLQHRIQVGGATEQQKQHRNSDQHVSENREGLFAVVVPPIMVAVYFDRGWAVGSKLLEAPRPIKGNTGEGGKHTHPECVMNDAPKHEPTDDFRRLALDRLVSLAHRLLCAYVDFPTLVFHAGENLDQQLVGVCGHQRPGFRADEFYFVSRSLRWTGDTGRPQWSDQEGKEEQDVNDVSFHVTGAWYFLQCNCPVNAHMRSLMPNQLWQQSHVSTHFILGSPIVASDASFCKRFLLSGVEPAELLDVLGEIKDPAFTYLEDYLRLRSTVPLGRDALERGLQRLKNRSGSQQRVKSTLHLLLDHEQVFVEITVVNVDRFTPGPLVEQVCLHSGWEMGDRRVDCSLHLSVVVAVR